MKENEERIQNQRRRNEIIFRARSSCSGDHDAGAVCCLRDAGDASRGDCMLIHGADVVNNLWKDGGTRSQACRAVVRRFVAKAVCGSHRISHEGGCPVWRVDSGWTGSDARLGGGVSGCGVRFARYQKCSFSSNTCCGVNAVGAQRHELKGANKKVVRSETLHMCLRKEEYRDSWWRFMKV